MLLQKTSALLAACSLLIQLLIAGFHVSPALALTGVQTDKSPLASPNRTILICTFSGLKRITVDQNNLPIDGNQPGRLDGKTCPLCLSFTSALPPTNTASLLVPPEQFRGSAPSLAEPCIGGIAQTISSARGPPAA